MKKVTYSLLLSIIAAGMFLISCSESNNSEPVEPVNPTDNPIEDQTEYEKITPITPDAQIKFSSQELTALCGLETMAFDLFKTASEGNVLTESTDGNFNLSPASAVICFTMFANSLDEPFRTNVARAVGFDSIEEMSAITAKLLAYLPADGLGVSVALANSIWYNKLLTINPEYKASMQETFRSPVTPLDFSDSDQAIAIINKWCRENTNDLIDNVINKLEPNTAAVWANALYFMGKWGEEFDPDRTRKANFAGRDGNTNVDMMNRETGAYYAKTDNAEMVSLLFAGGIYSLDLIYTDGETLTNQIYKSLINNSRNAIVDLSLPRFKISCKANLCKVFPNLATATKDATMTTMGVSPLLTLVNTSTVQKTVITVNEKGAEAAAVTITTAETAPGPGNEEEPERVKVTFDKPFSYVVRNNDNGIILFIGQVNNL